MLNANTEKTLTQLLALGVPAVSMFILTGSVSDPVNVTKFLLLGGIGTACLALVFLKAFNLLARTQRTSLILSGLFISFSFIAVIFSQSPLSQNIYGVYGRNTGFLTYLFLVGIFLAATLLNKEESFKKLFLGLFFTGLVNVIYCGWVVFFGDFVGWQNPYGNILGLFGNPNFIGAFLGIWISATIAYFVFSKTTLWIKLAIVAILLLGFYEVYKSRAVQGVVVSAAGIATVLFYWVRSRTKRQSLLATYTIAVLGFGFMALFGALQKGPLAEIVYKTSVSLRGAYWNAGLQTGFTNPFTGAGMDAYGDWYRRSRSEYNATILPGNSTVTNSAHNVAIDIFSYGGFPLLLSYLGILLLGAVAIVKNLRRTREFNPLFVALSVAWIGYQLQSIISINQIGLAVWGWVLTGALVAYESRFSRQGEKIESSDKPTRSKKPSTETFSSPLVAGLGVVAGLILAAPPISGDMAWFKATNSGNFVEVEKALDPSYLHPQDSSRLVNMVSILENSKLYDQALQYAIRATEFNPENFDSWNALYSVQKSTPEQKSLALANMRRLDPHNPELEKL
jgi:O-antigen ligase